MNNHNRKILDKSHRNNERTDILPCNCEKKDECPLDGRCNSENVLYQERIFPMEHRNEVERVYIGISARNEKQRLYNHGGARGVIVIVVGNGHGDMSSNPGRDRLNFT